MWQVRNSDWGADNIALRIDQHIHNNSKLEMLTLKKKKSFHCIDKFFFHFILELTLTQFYIVSLYLL